MRSTKPAILGLEVREGSQQHVVPVRVVPNFVEIAHALHGRSVHLAVHDDRAFPDGAGEGSRCP
eukprot:8006350-Pyramimonas_sp.AAC.1